MGAPAAAALPTRSITQSFALLTPPGHHGHHQPPFETHPELRAALATWQPKALFVQAAVGIAGQFGFAPYTPVSGITAISDLPSTQPFVPFILTSQTNSAGCSP